jgi:hypothetical protein
MRVTEIGIIYRESRATVKWTFVVDHARALRIQERARCHRKKPHLRSKRDKALG